MKSSPNSNLESPQLVETLFGAYRRQILALLLLQPSDSYYVREIARLTGVPVGSLHRELKLLTESGLLLRHTVGNQVRYEANSNCAIYPELAGIFRKTTGLADVLRELLAPIRDQISMALIFGSVAKGNAGATSDIDLLVVGSAAFADVVAACHLGTSSLQREVNPVVMSDATFQGKCQAGDRFIGRVFNEEKIYLIGGAHEFGKFSQNRAA